MRGIISSFLHSEIFLDLTAYITEQYITGSQIEAFSILLQRLSKRTTKVATYMLQLQRYTRSQIRIRYSRLVLY
uniref:Uncharacterized protein n=1 Tax=Arundo donax TaxID=35708 RepID=A0A0A9CPC4_ARUDO